MRSDVSMFRRGEVSSADRCAGLVCGKCLACRLRYVGYIRHRIDVIRSVRALVDAAVDATERARRAWGRVADWDLGDGFDLSGAQARDGRRRLDDAERCLRSVLQVIVGHLGEATDAAIVAGRCDLEEDTVVGTAVDPRGCGDGRVRR
jgi:hypothetical protein